MDLIQNIINKFRSPSAAKPAAHMKFSIKDHVLHIKKIHWIAPGTYSPNGQFFVAGKQSEVVLVDIEQKKILYHRDDFEQIIHYNLKVTNAGWVLIDNNEDQEERLQSTFFVLDQQGATRIHYTLGSNIDTCTISDNGQVAVVHTTPSAQVAYDQKLFVFDVASKQKIGNWQAQTGAPDAIHIDTPTQISLYYRKNKQDKHKSEDPVPANHERYTRHIYTIRGERLDDQYE